MYVAGSVGPLGISAEEARARGIDRAACFRDQVYALLEGGVQIIFFETFMDFDEMAIAYRATKEADCLTICSFSCPPEGLLATGMPLTDAFAGLREIGADIVGVNCTNGPHAMVQLLQRIPALDQPLRLSECRVSEIFGRPVDLSDDTRSFRQGSARAGRARREANWRLLRNESATCRGHGGCNRGVGAEAQQQQSIGKKNRSKHKFSIANPVRDVRWGGENGGPASCQ